MGVIKFPRVIVSQHRHHKLYTEAKKRKLPVSVVAEEKFMKADKHK